MEARKILFVLSNSSNQKSIMSEAETLGALKEDMRRAGINYDGMTFYEGRTRTELKDDASVLPVNVPVPAKGTNPATTTNDLVFMLTTANKKIKSGALSPERKNVLDEIKAKGLGTAVTAKFGKNATQCKTPDLLAFLAEQPKPASQVATEAPKAKKGEKVAVDENPDITIIEVIKGEPIAGVTPCTECVDTCLFIHISEPTRQAEISYAVFCLKKKKHNNGNAYTATYKQIKHKPERCGNKRANREKK